MSIIFFLFSTPCSPSFHHTFHPFSFHLLPPNPTSSCLLFYFCRSFTSRLWDLRGELSQQPKQVSYAAWGRFALAEGISSPLLCPSELEVWWVAPESWDPLVADSGMLQWFLRNPTRFRRAGKGTGSVAVQETCNPLKTYGKGLGFGG